MKDKIGRGSEWTVDKNLEGIVDSSNIGPVRPGWLRLALAAGSVEIAGVRVVLLSYSVQDEVVGGTQVRLLLLLLLYCSCTHKFYLNVFMTEVVIQTPISSINY